MPLEAPVITATLLAMNAVSLSDSGLGRLVDVRICRHPRADGDHGGSAAGAPDANGPADDAGHDGHRRPRPRPPARGPDPPRQRPAFSPLLPPGVRTPGPSREPAGRP